MSYKLDSSLLPNIRKQLTDYQLVISAFDLTEQEFEKMFITLSQEKYIPKNAPPSAIIENASILIYLIQKHFSGLTSDSIRINETSKKLESFLSFLYQRNETYLWMLVMVHLQNQILPTIEFDLPISKMPLDEKIGLMITVNSILTRMFRELRMNWKNEMNKIARNILQ